MRSTLRPLPYSAWLLRIGQEIAALEKALLQVRGLDPSVLSAEGGEDGMMVLEEGGVGGLNLLATAGVAGVECLIFVNSPVDLIATTLLTPNNACLPYVLDLQVQLRFGLVSGWERKGGEVCIRRYLRSIFAVHYEEPPSEAVLSNYEDLKCNPDGFSPALLYHPAALHEARQNFLQERGWLVKTIVKYPDLAWPINDMNREANSKKSSCDNRSSSKLVRRCVYFFSS